MRIAVSGNGYASATNAFLDANQLAASTAHALMDALAHSAAMAGHTAASFAASYDEAAQQSVCSLVDLVDALANLGRISEATHRNHAYAEARAVVGRPSTTEVATPRQQTTYAHLTPRLPPSSAGTHGHLIPGWAAWILDQVEGFVWPDSDVDRLRATAHAWRTASGDLELIKARCFDAAFSLSLEIAPDVELAVDAIRRFATQVDSLAQTFHGLARSCDNLADQVHSHREQVLEIVRDTLRDAVVIEGIGLVLGAVTGGITAAAATSVNGARIAAIAPRIIRIIEGLRIAIGASETGARIASASVVEVRATLQAFVKAQLILSDRGAAMPFYWYEATKEGRRLLRRAPGWLLAQERPGHTFENHIGKSDDWLLDRVAKKGLQFASTFPDAATAEKAIHTALDENSHRIAAWLTSGDPKLEIDHVVEDVVGRTCHATGECRDMRSFRIVLKPDNSMPGGYYVLTAFPRLRRP